MRPFFIFLTIRNPNNMFGLRMVKKTKWLQQPRQFYKKIKKCFYIKRPRLVQPFWKLQFIAIDLWFENRTLKRSVFEWIWNSKIRYSSPHCIQILTSNSNHWILPVYYMGWAETMSQYVNLTAARDFKDLNGAVLLLFSL